MLYSFDRKYQAWLMSSDGEEWEEIPERPSTLERRRHPYPSPKCPRCLNRHAKRTSASSWLCTCGRRFSPPSLR